jgi:hypothetical protein
MLYKVLYFSNLTCRVVRFSIKGSRRVKSIAIMGKCYNRFVLGTFGSSLPSFNGKQFHHSLPKSLANSVW